MRAAILGRGRSSVGPAQRRLSEQLKKAQRRFLDLWDGAVAQLGER